MIKVLTAIIGSVANGPNAKAIAGGVAGAMAMFGNSAVDAFVDGFSRGTVPRIEELGVMVGQALAGWIVGYVITWLSPKNTTK